MPTISIVLTAGQAARVQSAFQFLYPGETIDVPFVKQKLVQHLRGMVIQAERDMAVRAVQDGHVDQDFDPA